MSRVISFPQSNQPSDRNRCKIVVEAIKLMLGNLSPDERDAVLKEVAEIFQPISAPRAGEVLGTIVQLLPRRSEWTVDEIKHEVASRGVEASPKEIYNSLGYLVRRQHIQRIGYGRYLVDGAELRTLDDIGFGPAPDDCER